MIRSSGRGGFGDGGMSRAYVEAVVVDVVGVHLREQEGVYQHRDKNYENEDIVSGYWPFILPHSNPL